MTVPKESGVGQQIHSKVTAVERRDDCARSSKSDLICVVQQICLLTRKCVDDDHCLGG